MTCDRFVCVFFFLNRILWNSRKMVKKNPYHNIPCERIRSEMDAIETLNICHFKYITSFCMDWYWLTSVIQCSKNRCSSLMRSIVWIWSILHSFIKLNLMSCCDKIDCAFCESTTRWKERTNKMVRREYFEFVWLVSFCHYNTIISHVAHFPNFSQ